MVSLWCNPDGCLPCLDHEQNQGVVNSERFFWFELLILWVVQALGGVRVPEKNIIEPLDGDCRNSPFPGLVELLAQGFPADDGMIVFGEVAGVSGADDFYHLLDIVPVPVLETGESEAHAGAWWLEVSREGEVNGLSWGEDLLVYHDIV